MFPRRCLITNDCYWFLFVRYPILHNILLTALAYIKIRVKIWQPTYMAQCVEINLAIIFLRHPLRLFFVGFLHIHTSCIWQRFLKYKTWKNFFKKRLKRLLHLWLCAWLQTGGGAGEVTWVERSQWGCVLVITSSAAAAAAAAVAAGQTPPTVAQYMASSRSLGLVKVFFPVL